MKGNPECNPRPLEAVILAGGLSTRMGVDKANLLLQGRSMLSMVRRAARDLDVPVRVIRKDAVARCGPLGGIMTALQTTRAEAVLFLACDMPLVSTDLLKRLLLCGRLGVDAVFTVQKDRVGFPFLLPRSAMDQVTSQIARGAFSLHELATSIQAKLFEAPAGSLELLNINTPRDRLEAARWLQKQPREVKK